MRFVFALLGLLLCSSAYAQGCGNNNPNCIVPNRPAGDSTNAAANTRFVTSAVSGSGLAVGSSGISGGTNGRILYDNSGVLGERAPSGNGTSVATTTGSLTSGNCTKIDANGNLVDAGAPCGTLVLLNTLTASNSASLSDTTSLTGAYKNYLIVYTDVVCSSSAAAGLQAQLSTNGGTSYLATGYSATTWATNNTTTTSTTALMLSTSAQNFSGAPGVSGYVYLYNPSAAAVMPYSGNGVEFLTGTGIFGVLPFGTTSSNSGPFDAIKFFFTANNIASGVFNIYGIQ